MTQTAKRTPKLTQPVFFKACRLMQESKAEISATCKTKRDIANFLSEKLKVTVGLATVSTIITAIDMKLNDFIARAPASAAGSPGETNRQDMRTLARSIIRLYDLTSHDPNEALIELFERKTGDKYHRKDSAPPVSIDSIVDSIPSAKTAK